MSLLARFYIYSMIVAGLAMLGYSTESWQVTNPAQFSMYLIVTLLASGLKIRVPNVTGTMSVHFLFTLIGFVQLSLAETLLLGCGSVLLQCFWRARKRPTPIHIMFNVASTALATFAGFATYHSPVWSRAGMGFPLALGLAAIVFFVANTVSIALVVALTENKSPLSLWRECYFWCFPYYLIGAIVAGLFSILSRYIGWEMSLLSIPMMVVIFQTYKRYLERLNAEKVQAQKIAALHLRTIEALALAIEAKDHTTHQHLERVKVYSAGIAQELGLPEAQIRALEAAALLHDIGKLAVPEHIISKSGKLTPEEFEKMKIHPVVGAEILDRVEFPYPVSPIVAAHHEKWDGSGYPYGLRGEEIPIGARILAAVDCLDALASERQYRQALPLDEAMKSVANLAGSSFDPTIVEILGRRYAHFERLIQNRTQASEQRGVGAGPTVSAETTLAKPEKSSGPDSGIIQATDFLSSIAAARQEAQELFELAKDLGNSLSLNETLWVMSARVKRMVAYDALCIFLLKDGKLVPEFATGENSEALALLRVPIGEGISGWVAEHRQPILNGSPPSEPGFLEASAHSMALNSALAVPLEGMEGVIGVLALYGAAQDAFTKDQLRVLLAISSKMAASLENALKYEQATTSATTDFLTSLPNARSLFVHLDGEVSRCARASMPLAVLVCDLDGFKMVNDRFGHLSGNSLLRFIATRLKEACRNYDYVARMGGDEFVIVMPGIEPAKLDERVAEFERIAVSAGQTLFGEEVVSLSVGYALLGVDAADAEGLLAEADRRMYRSKQQRKIGRGPGNAVQVSGQATPAVQ